MAATTISILRPASSLRTRTTSNRVTFADDLINLALNKLPLPIPRRPPPSTAVPSLPALPSVARRKDKRREKKDRQKQKKKTKSSDKQLKDHKPRKPTTSSRYSARSTSHLTESKRHHRCKKHDKRKTRQRDPPSQSLTSANLQRHEERRLTQIRNAGALANAKHYIRSALRLDSSQDAWDMWDVVDAKALYKIYLYCRKRCTVDSRTEAAIRVYDANLRRWMIEEDAELKALLRARADPRPGKSKLNSEDRRNAKRKRAQLSAFVARELTVQMPSLRKLKRSQLDKAAISAAMARAERICSCDR